MTKLRWTLALLAPLLSGCSFFEARVLRHDERIMALQEELAALPSSEPRRLEIIGELEEERGHEIRILALEEELSALPEDAPERLDIARQLEEEQVHRTRILDLEEELAALSVDSPAREALLDELEAEKAAREEALEGAQQEAANKQALLMALISLGAGGLKILGGMAAKGA